MVVVFKIQGCSLSGLLLRGASKCDNGVGDRDAGCACVCAPTSDISSELEGKSGVLMSHRRKAGDLRRQGFCN